jgi:hypothetical protein
MYTNVGGRNLIKRWHRWLFSGEVSEGTSYHDWSAKVIKDDVWASVGETGIWVKP